MKATLTCAGVVVLLGSALVGFAQPPDQAPQRRMQMMMQMRPMMQQMGPMMQQMHQRQAAPANDWAATDEAVFVLRAGQLLKYDNDLKLVKTVDLPKAETAAQEEPEDGDPPAQRPRMQQRMQQMQRMMTLMHSALPAGIKVTPEALFVAGDNRLLKYDHDLNLEQQADVPAASSEQVMQTCPMCQQMLEQMKRMQAGGGQPSGDQKNQEK